MTLKSNQKVSIIRNNISIIQLCIVPYNLFFHYLFMYIEETIFVNCCFTWIFFLNVLSKISNHEWCIFPIISTCLMHYIILNYKVSNLICIFVKNFSWNNFIYLISSRGYKNRSKWAWGRPRCWNSIVYIPENNYEICHYIL